MSLTRVVAITGCDSGLGYALATRAAREGMVTVAGMLNGTQTTAANSLEKLTVHPYPLDVTNNESVAEFGKYVSNLIEVNPGYKTPSLTRHKSEAQEWRRFLTHYEKATIMVGVASVCLFTSNGHTISAFTRMQGSLVNALHAVVNNAGVMTIGDYEWQTPSMIVNTVNVNLLGAMRVASTFLPLLRKGASEAKFKPRIINVASHCGLQPLPGFGPYSASKAGLLAWTRALRLELQPYGLKAVAFVPGGFIGSSNLMSTQASQCSTMLDQLNPEQRSFYEARITALGDFLQNLAHNASLDALIDVNIIDTFVRALTDKHPREMYKVESWRYAFYYNLLKLPLPETVRLWLIKKFLRFPEA